MVAFFDTNIILYSLLSDNALKSDISVALLQDGGVISVQVLNEMIAVLRSRKKWPWEQVDVARLATQSALDVVDLTLESQNQAVGISQRFGFTIYDANIIASAKLAGCDIVWTEDMQHGQIVEGVKLLNPFLDVTQG